MRGIGFWRTAAAVLCLVTVLAIARAEPRTAALSAPAPAPLRVMPLGASSTVGKGSPATAGYRGPLQELLARDGVRVDLVGSLHDGPATVRDRDHEGRSGWTLARMAPLVADWVRQARPDIVLLHAGTNDLLHGVSPRVAADRLAAVLDAIAAVSDAHVIVAGVWAPLPGRIGERAEFARRAAAVVAAHRARGHSVRYLDTSNLLTRGDLADGLHPNAAGYRKIAALWEREIEAYLRVRQGLRPVARAPRSAVRRAAPGQRASRRRARPRPAPVRRPAGTP